MKKDLYKLREYENKSITEPLTLFIALDVSKGMMDGVLGTGKTKFEMMIEQTKSLVSDISKKSSSAPIDLKLCSYGSATDTVTYRGFEYSDVVVALNWLDSLIPTQTSRDYELPVEEANTYFNTVASPTADATRKFYFMTGGDPNPLGSAADAVTNYPDIINGTGIYATYPVEIYGVNIDYNDTQYIDLIDNTGGAAEIDMTAPRAIYEYIFDTIIVPTNTYYLTSSDENETYENNEYVSTNIGRSNINLTPELKKNILKVKFQLNDTLAQEWLDPDKNTFLNLNLYQKRPDEVVKPFEVDFIDQFDTPTRQGIETGATDNYVYVRDTSNTLRRFNKITGAYVDSLSLGGSGAMLIVGNNIYAKFPLVKYDEAFNIIWTATNDLSAVGPLGYNAEDDLIIRGQSDDVAYAPNDTGEFSGRVELGDLSVVTDVCSIGEYVYAVQAITGTSIATIQRYLRDDSTNPSAFNQISCNINPGVFVTTYDGKIYMTSYDSSTVLTIYVFDTALVLLKTFVITGVENFLRMEIDSNGVSYLASVSSAYPGCYTTVLPDVITAPLPNPKQIWEGFLNTAGVGKGEIALNFASNITYMSRQGLTRTYQRTCSHSLYGRGCNVYKDDTALTNVKVVGTVSNIVGKRLTISNIFADNYFTHGILQYDDKEVFIRYQAGNFFWLNTMIPELQDYFDANGSAPVIIYAGCDKIISTCKNTFNNVENFGGFPYINENSRVIE